MDELAKYSMTWLTTTEDETWILPRREDACVVDKADPAGILEYISQWKRGDEYAELRREVYDLRAIVERHEILLNTFFPTGDGVEIGSFEKWMNSENAKEYLGKHVAFLEGHGIVRHADTLDELWEEVRQMDTKDSIEIGYVPGD